MSPSPRTKKTARKYDRPSSSSGGELLTIMFGDEDGDSDDDHDDKDEDCLEEDAEAQLITKFYRFIWVWV